MNHRSCFSNFWVFNIFQSSDCPLLHIVTCVKRINPKELSLPLERTAFIVFVWFFSKLKLKFNTQSIQSLDFFNSQIFVTLRLQEKALSSSYIFPPSILPLSCSSTHQRACSCSSELSCSLHYLQ